MSDNLAMTIRMFFPKISLQFFKLLFVICRHPKRSPYISIVIHIKSQVNGVLESQFPFTINSHTNSLPPLFYNLANRWDLTITILYLH